MNQQSHEGKEAPEAEQQQSSALNQAALSSLESTEMHHQQLIDDAETTNTDATPAQEMPFASLGPSLAMPFAPESQTSEAEIDDSSNRRRHSDPTVFSLREMGQAIPVPMEVERDIVSRLAASFQTEDRTLASDGSSTELNTMGDLLQRLAIYFRRMKAKERRE